MADGTKQPDTESNEAPDLEALAKQFLDLWQSQIAASAGDSELANLMERGIATQSNMVAEALRAFSPSGLSGLNATGPEQDDASPRPEAAGASSEHRDGDVAELARRLDACEKRLAALERKPGGRGPGTGRTAGKRKS